ncbi:MAG: hypothetical protein ACYC92_03150 [Candidatus Acidiferrales bacterium]
MARGEDSWSLAGHFFRFRGWLIFLERVLARTQKDPIQHCLNQVPAGVNRYTNLWRKVVFCNARIVTENGALDKAILPFERTVSHLETTRWGQFCALSIRKSQMGKYSLRTCIPGIMPADKLT